MLLSASAYAGDDSADPQQPPPQPESIDLKDVWHQLRHQDRPDPFAPPAEKPFFVVTPSVASKPSTGLTVGLSGVLAFVAGDHDTTHLSSASANLKFSVKSQVMSSIRFAAFSSDDRWLFVGENRLWWTSQTIHNLGLTAAGATDLRYDWFRAYDTAYRRIGSSRLFVGGGLNVNDHTNVRLSGAPPVDESAYAAYTAQHALPTDGQMSSGANVALVADTRDNAINAERGWLASATYRTFFDGFLGGDTSWQEVNLDVRTYRALDAGGRHKLAFWFLGDLVTSGTAPFLDLPATAGDMYGRSARGYSDGQFRGPRLLYGEVEYRTALVRSGLVGMVAFLNTTTLDGSEPDQRLFRSFASGAGAGLRVLLDKHTKTNLCADYGVGIHGSRGFYLALQEAF